MRTHRIQQMLLDARKAAGLTQSELARKAKLDLANIANYETRIIPPLDKIDQLAKALKLIVHIELRQKRKTERG